MMATYDSLAKNYALVIIAGDRTIEDCPVKIKERTQYWLTQLGQADNNVKGSQTQVGNAADPIHVKTKVQVPSDAPHIEASSVDTQVASVTAATTNVDTPASDQATN